MDILYAVLVLLTDPSVLLGCLIISLFIVYRRVLIDRRNGLPPGPRFRLPFIGNMYDVDRDMRKFLRKYRRKYGDIYSLYFGNELTVIIAGYGKLKEAFVKNGEAFSDRPKGRNLLNDITKGRVDQLVYILGDFFFAGTDTTSSVLLWALAYLVNFPDIQKEMFNNIKETIGLDRLPEVQDKAKIPLVEAFLQECLRHANLTFTTLPHATSRDIEFGGYLIRKGTTVLGDLDSVNKDREQWKDPEVFRPQRFIDESGSLKTPEQFIPFSLGRRNCRGESLAKMEMFLFFSAIAQNFNISAAPGEDMP